MRAARYGNVHRHTPPMAKVKVHIKRATILPISSAIPAAAIFGYHRLAINYSSDFSVASSWMFGVWRDFGEGLLFGNCRCGDALRWLLLVIKWIRFDDGSLGDVDVWKTERLRFLCFGEIINLVPLDTLNSLVATYLEQEFIFMCSFLRLKNSVSCSSRN